MANLYDKVELHTWKYRPLIGADPEVFAKKAGTFVSAHGMIPGDKKNPHKVDDGAVQVDGMALEFNINPARDEEEFVYNLSSVMAQLRAMVPADTELCAVPVADFTEEYIESQPEEAKELGCDADFNAYTGKQNPVPNARALFRTASGHIHVGLWDPFGPIPMNHAKVCRDLARALDVYLGVPFLFVDGDHRRRELYGKAGAYRMKPYGMEYRTLSNVWLTDNKLQRWVYQQTLKAIASLRSDRQVWNALGVQTTIDTGNLKRARDIIERRKIDLPAGVSI